MTNIITERTTDELPPGRCPLPVIQEALAKQKAWAIANVPNYHHWNSTAPGWYANQAQSSVLSGYQDGYLFSPLVKRLLNDRQEVLLCDLFGLARANPERGQSNNCINTPLLIGLRAGLAKAESDAPAFTVQWPSSKWRQVLLAKAGYSRE